MNLIVIHLYIIDSFKLGLFNVESNKSMWRTEENFPVHKDTSLLQQEHDE